MQHISEESPNPPDSESARSTVKLDAAALQKLVVSTVLQLNEDENEDDSDGGGA